MTHQIDTIQNNEILSFALRTSPNAVSISRLTDGKILDINDIFIQLLGWNRDEVVGKSSLEFSFFDDPGERQHVVSLIETTGRLTNYELVLKKRNGNYITVLLSAEVLQMPDEKIMVTTLQDITQVKNTLHELKEVERRYQKLFNTSTNAIAHCRIITDANHKPIDFDILQVNDTYVKTTGIPKDAVEGKTAREAFPGIEGRPFDFIGKYGKIALEGGELNFESYNDKIDRWFNVYVYSPHTGEFTTIFTDITQRKKLEHLQKQDKELFEGIFNNIPVMITIFDPELNNFKFNKELVNTLGWTDEDGNAGNFMMKVYPDPEYRQKVEDYMKSLEPGWKEWRTTAKDGTIVDTIWANIMLSTGKLVGIGVDIRNRKKAEEALRESEERFSTIFRAMPIGVSLTEIETGQIIDVNDAGLEFTGCNRKEEVVGKTTMGLNVINPNERNKVIAELKQNGSVKNAELRFRTFQNETKVVSLNLNKVVINGRDFLLSTSMDITQRKQLEETLRIQNIELQQAKEKAEENDQLKSIFLANMSHEIRTPMTGILGFTDLLKSADITGEQKLEYVNIIESSGNRMLQIINDLIDISKIEAKQVEINKQFVNIPKMLNELNFFFKPEAVRKKLDLKLTNNLTEDYFYTFTDELKLTQILSNLLKNAIKFTDTGSIEFGCEFKNSNYKFYVKDTGRGIARNIGDKIFERFYQGDVDYCAKSEGVGLGLAISRAYVEMLGGKIFVETEPGTGSDFYFTLPLVSGTVNSPRASSDKTEIITLENKQILIAEDDETVFFLLKEILRRMKINIIHASDGNEAVNLTRLHQDLDLIIMDTKMPNLNGLEATQMIRKFNCTIPIIALSAYSYDSDKQKALSAGCNDYITKPMNKNDLINKLLIYIK